MTSAPNPIHECHDCDSPPILCPAGPGHGRLPEGGPGANPGTLRALFISFSGCGGTLVSVRQGAGRALSTIEARLVVAQALGLPLRGAFTLAIVRTTPSAIEARERYRFRPA